MVAAVAGVVAAVVAGATVAGVVVGATVADVVAAVVAGGGVATAVAGVVAAAVEVCFFVWAAILLICCEGVDCLILL